jgi:hypothetical protein
MSFILDQLKKSGKRREIELAIRSKAGIQSTETAVTLQTDFEPTSGHGFHMRGIYLLLFLAVASLSALGGFIFFHWEPGSRQAPVVSTQAKVHTAEPAMPKAESARPESVLPVDRGTPMPPESSSKAGPEKAVSAPAIVKKMPDGKVKNSMPVAVAELRNQPGSRAQEQKTAPSPAEKSEAQDVAHRTPYLNELPASLKNALPLIHITSHLYRGDSRLVSINGRIMSEGIKMDDGLFLEEITPEGVVLSFRGHRFRVRAD